MRSGFPHRESAAIDKHKEAVVDYAKYSECISALRKEDSCDRIIPINRDTTNHAVIGESQRTLRHIKLCATSSPGRFASPMQPAASRKATSKRRPKIPCSGEKFPVQTKRI